MARTAIFLLVSCSLILGLEAGCYYLGMRYKTGQNFEIGGCLKCKCPRSGRVECAPDCPPPIKCPDGAEPVTVYGECCPSCPGPEPTFEHDVPKSADC